MGVGVNHKLLVVSRTWQRHLDVHRAEESAVRCVYAPFDAFGYLARHALGCQGAGVVPREVVSGGGLGGGGGSCPARLSY